MTSSAAAGDAQPTPAERGQKIPGGQPDARSSATTLPPGCNPACQGCRHRDWPESRSLAQKHAYLTRALGPWVDRLEAVRSPAASGRLGYRERATLSTAWTAESGWQFGLVRHDRFLGDVLIPIPDCPVHAARLRGLVSALATVLPPAADFPLAFLHVAGAQATLIVKAATVATPWLARLMPDLQRLGFEGLWLNLHPAAGRRLFWKRGWQLLWGQTRSRDTAGLLYGPGAFQQLLPALYGEAVALAAGFLLPGPADGVLDLYCGIGQTLARWGAGGAASLGVELAAEAVACARANAPAATVLPGTCTERLPQVREWWLRVPGRRLAWVNPPRSGLEPPVLAAFAGERAGDLRADALAYLSCSAGTLARDLGLLVAAGYRVTRLVPFDFFPQTHHVEVLALLDGPGRG